MRERPAEGEDEPVRVVGLAAEDDWHQVGHRLQPKPCMPRADAGSMLRAHAANAAQCRTAAGLLAREKTARWTTAMRKMRKFLPCRTSGRFYPSGSSVLNAEWVAGMYAVD